MSGRPVRVLHVIDSLNLGGAQEIVLNLTACGHARFHHEVATLHGRGVYWERLASRGVPLHSLSPHKLIPLYIPRLAMLLHRGSFDILHCHLVASNILAKPIGALCGVPVILNHDHTNDSYRATQRVRLALDSLTNRAATHVIAVSASCRDFLVQREHVPSAKISLVKNAIDLTRFTPDHGARANARHFFSIAEDTPLIVGVGRLHPQKNFHLFLEIAARIVKQIPNATFLIAGVGSEEATLREAAQRLGLSERVHFAGYVADTRLVYQSADLLLMPSRFEGLPMTLLEAMAMRVPVVASALDGIAEVVTDRKDGLLCDPNDADAFAQSAVLLLSDNRLAGTLADNARATVSAQYSVTRMVAEVESIYDRFSP